MSLIHRVVASSIGLLVGAGVALADAPKSAPPAEKNVVRVIRQAVVPHVTNVDVRDLPAATQWKPGDPIKIIPRLRTHFTPEGRTLSGGPDPLLEIQKNAKPNGTRALNGTIINMAGQGFSGVNPPDTVGAVGTNHYIQMINASTGTLVQIYNKDGTTASAQFTLDSLGAGNCANGLGDPIVLFDWDADRWFISEFSNAGNQLCVYISQTSDPVSGGWFNYAFTAVNSFPDYPKYGVWSDAYYLGTNESAPTLYAFDRTNMLAGNAASMQSFNAPPLGGFGFQMVTPATLTGANLPPGGSPGLFLRHRDTEAHGAGNCPNAASSDCLEIFEFTVDWVTPANSSLSAPIPIEISEIDSDLCGLVSFNCFPQPGSGTTLDPLREVTMFPNQYRNFGSHETLVGTLTTDVSGSDQGGIRWFELRNTGSGWFLHQEGTYAPDGHSRFMGSAAMDGAGNLAVAYNITSNTVHPGLRYTGREAADPMGTTPQGEFVIVDGSSANSSNRYGDYSAISLDPVDDATFWFTGEYNTSGNWSTRIASFQFDQDPDYTLAVSPTTLDVCPPANGVYTVDVGERLGYMDPVTLSVAGEPAGTTATFSTNPVTPVGQSTLTISNTGAAALGSSTLTISGMSTSGPKDVNVTLNILDTNLGAATLLTPTNMATDVSIVPTLTWNAVSGAQDYLLEVDDDPAFGSIDYSVVESNTSHMIATPLVGTTTYYWRVQARNTCDTAAFSSVFQFTTSNITCATFNSTDVPARIPPNGTSGTTTSDVDVTLSGNIIDIDVVNLQGVHTYMGDLDFFLASPTGTSVYILDTSSCGTLEDFDLILDDEAGSPPPCPPVGGGAYTPSNALSGFDGEDPGGLWTLTIVDNFTGDTGNLTDWGLYICTSGGGGCTGADMDMDGFDDCNDCNDNDPNVNPGASEATCDGIDNDCNAATLDDPDGDMDGVGVCNDCNDGDPNINPNVMETTCDGIDNDCNAATLDDPDGDMDGVGVCNDCNDGDPNVNPNAMEMTCDGIDNDCNAATLDDPDGDMDGVGVCNDCNDADPNINPNAGETTCDNIDNDCNAATLDDPDGDMDGVGVCNDCNDADPNINPNASETTCDMIDNDCDPATEDDPDGDMDGVGVCTDCDDADPNVNPNASEATCDGIDNDCDPATEDDPDGDMDGVGMCTDCDDANPDVNPNASEICDGLDNDCDGVIPDDEADSDGDGVLTCDDNCPDVANADQADADGDGLGDPCDEDVGTPDSGCCSAQNDPNSLGGMFLLIGIVGFSLRRRRRQYLA